jgi:hypothetical protein
MCQILTIQHSMMVEFFLGPIMTSDIECLPVSVTFDLKSNLSVVSPSVVCLLSHLESVSQFCEILMASYQGCSLMANIDFEVACNVDADIVIGMN